MKKQATALVIAASLVLSMGSMAQAATNGGVQLNAQTEGHFAAGAFKHLVSMNMIAEEVAVTPNAEINRKEMKNLIAKVIGKPVVDNNETTEAVTRVEVAQWIASSLPPMNTGINGHNLPYPYLDTAEVTAEQRTALHELYKLGIMVGDGTGRFSPKKTLTRGEAAVLLDNVLSRTMSNAREMAFEKHTGELPETVYTVMNENKYEAGVYSVEDGGFTYVIVAGGAQPNGGYGISVNGVSETDAGVFIDASLHAPGPGEMHAQVITYPVDVIKVKTTKKPFYKKGELAVSKVELDERK